MLPPDVLWLFEAVGVSVGRTVGIFTGRVACASVLPAVSRSPMEPWAEDMHSNPTTNISAIHNIFGK